MSQEMLNKLNLRKKFKHIQAIQNLLENSTQLADYLTGKSQPVAVNNETPHSNGYQYDDGEPSFYFETDPTVNATRIVNNLSNRQLATTIEENFFYQHIFNFLLVVILLLQVLVVWAFIWCRLSKYSKQPIILSNPQDDEEAFAMREMGELPELIPQHHLQQQEEHDRDEEGNDAAGEIFVENRCGRNG